MTFSEKIIGGHFTEKLNPEKFRRTEQKAEKNPFQSPWGNMWSLGWGGKSGGSFCLEGGEKGSGRGETSAMRRKVACLAGGENGRTWSWVVNIHNEKNEGGGDQVNRPSEPIDGPEGA